MQQSVCHVEFASNNMAESIEFFTKLFGWQVTPMGDEYALWSPGGGKEELAGGFTFKNKTDCGPDGNRTIVYIAVDDIEAKCKLIESLGGEIIIPKTKISDEFGYFAHFRDPQGTVVGLWSK